MKQLRYYHLVALGALLATCLLLPSAAAQDIEGVPVIIEAEDGATGFEFEPVMDEEGVSYIRIITDHSETTGSTTFPGLDRTALYEVTFPAPGQYDLYVRMRVGPATFDDDSFFYGSGFGEKNPENPDDWILVNNLADAGFANPDEWVVGAGSAANGVWKWINLTENQLTGEVPYIFEVSEGALTQLFDIGGRENGLDIDKFAFAPADYYYTVANLDNGEAGVLELPSEPVGPPLAHGLDKWLGTAISPNQTLDAEHYFNQFTPENNGKWGSVEGTRDVMNWAPLDANYQLAKDNGYPFRFHVLVWGSQQPNWIEILPADDQLAEIREWFEAVAERYPDIDYLEVVNEPLHQPPDIEHEGNYIEALGGAGETGWDWVITAFEMAREIFPPTTRLLINDYGILGSTAEAQRYLNVIRLLQDRDLIDGIGVQGHAFSTRPGAPLQQVLNLLATTGLPIQVTEMDVDGNPNQNPAVTDEQSDQNQLADMQRIFPVLWEHPSVEGITFWGWRPGLWRQGQEAFLIRSNGEERPALVWLRQYLEEYRQTVRSEPPHSIAEARLIEGGYPNPTSGLTHIRYALSQPAHAVLRVYDVLGREVRTLVDAYQSAGTYTASLDASSLAPGVYVYRIESGSRQDSGRLVVTR